MKKETFQDPSVLMKRAFFRSLLIVTVAVVLYMFCVVPDQVSLQKAMEAKKALEKKRDEMKNRVAGGTEARGEEEELSFVLTNKMEKLLLKRDEQLGDYESAAKDLLAPVAMEMGLDIRVSNEKREPRRLPLPASVPPFSPNVSRILYARKPIRLTCTGTFQSINSFLLKVEDIAAGRLTKEMLKREFEDRKREFDELKKTEAFANLTEDEKETRTKEMDILGKIPEIAEKISGVTLEAFTLKAQQGNRDEQSATLVFEWPIKLENTSAAAQGGEKK